eukprot:TRINITY_DN44774_c0_g1_i1.p1 TRINITY_DN44774_c0_g1~~TRINITY_DN44774_c0_g1_i1.p1  ORF type:complete len:103 (+),score=10.17 TRINITY_DN44774_c0_g1_i1:86-394(+)
MIRRPPRSTLSSSSAASDVYKRQVCVCVFYLMQPPDPLSGRRERGGRMCVCVCMWQTPSAVWNIERDAPTLLIGMGLFTYAYPLPLFPVSYTHLTLPTKRIV